MTDLVPFEPSDALPAVTADTRARDTLALAWLQAKENDSVSTATAYARDIRDYFGWLDERGLDAFGLIPAAIDQYRRHLQTAEHVGRYRGKRKLADSTVARKLTAVSSYYRYGQQNRADLVRWNPAEHVARPKVANVSLTLGLTRTEIERMLKVAAGRGARDYALVMLLATTGLRIGEVIGADTGDVKREGDAWYLEVRRKGGHRALVGIPPVTARALRRYMRGRRGALFQGRTDDRITLKAAQYALMSTAKAAGLDQWKRVTPHVFRHSVATMLLDDGISISDVQVLLGHTTISTTARYDRARRERNNPGTKRLGEVFEDGLPDVTD